MKQIKFSNSTKKWMKKTKEPNERKKKISKKILFRIRKKKFRIHFVPPSSGQNLQ